MKNRKEKTPDCIVALKLDDVSPGLEELRRSHSILQALIALVPAGNRSEFVELLQSLVENGKSPQSTDPDRRRTLQIVEEVRRQGHSSREVARHMVERRVGERRKGDRRQQQPNNYGRPWTREQVQTLETLVRQNTPIRRIALKLGRTSTAIQSKAKEMDLPLKMIS